MPEEITPDRIVSLEIENVKKIKSMLIKPDGSIFIVGGRNGQGKSTAIDCILMVLKGKGAVPGEPIRKGQPKGETVMTTERFVAKRTFTKKDSYLTVRFNDGSTPTGGAQEFLNALFGSSIDPEEFMHLRPSDQMVQAAEALGIDLYGMQDRRKNAKDGRRDVNRDIKKLKAQTDGLPALKKGMAYVDIADVMGQITAIGHRNAERQELIDMHQDEIAEVEGLDAEIQALEEALEESRSQRERLVKSCDKAAVAAKKAGEMEDDNALRAEIESAQEKNQVYEQAQRRKGLENQLAGLEKQVRTYETELSTIDEEQAAAIAATDFPMEGLTIGEDSIRYNDLPFDQCSTSEQIIIGTAIALEANPEFPVVLIKRGNALDMDSKDSVIDMTSAKGGQVFMEVVTTKASEADIIIEDGAILEQDYEAP